MFIHLGHVGRRHQVDTFERYLDSFDAAAEQIRRNYVIQNGRPWHPDLLGEPWFSESRCGWQKCLMQWFRNDNHIVLCKILSNEWVKYSLFFKYVIHPTVYGSTNYAYFNDGWRDHPGNQGLAEPKFVFAHTLRALVPQAKLIFIIRQPTERWSVRCKVFE